MKAAVAVLIVLRLAAQLILDALNGAAARRSPPSPWVGYSLAKTRFSIASEISDAVILAAALFSGILPWIAGKIQGAGAPGSPWLGAAFLVAVGVLFGAVSLPFDAWEQFRLEAKFGFNRAGPGLWMADKAKGLALGLALGYPLLAALLFLVGRAGRAWWIWGFALVFAVQLILLLLYPRLILPLFNRLSPLPEGPLRSRLLALAGRTGFTAAAIEVMDGSRRSAHSNAFFTGFGRFRHIVLFDTLMSQLEPAELEAVLAHEIGHYRLGHVPKHLVISAAASLLGFGLVAWLAREPWFNGAFGFSAGNVAASFLLFGLLGGLVTFWISPLFKLLSRKHEYEADAFAREAMSDPAPLRSALRRLAEKNLSNLAPHPWYSGFYHSHPTLVEREAALGGPR